MSSTTSKAKTTAPAKPAPTMLPDMFGGMNPFVQAWGPVGEYVVDVTQRTILFWDLLRRRSEQYYAQKAKRFPAFSARPTRSATSRMIRAPRAMR